MCIRDRFKSLQNNEHVLLLAIADGITVQELNEGPLAMFAFGNNVVQINEPSPHQRYVYFKTIANLLKMKPTEYMESRKRRTPIAELPAIETQATEVDEDGNVLTEAEIQKRELRKYQHQDMKLKNTLKIKLSGLMDLFKNRYKRFRKPPIDDALLIHLFDPTVYLSLIHI